MISSQKIAVLLVDGTRSAMFKEFVVYQPYRCHGKRSFVFIFVQVSTCEVPNVDKRGTCSTHREELSENLLQKFQPLTQFGPRISYCHFSQSLAHA